MTQRAWCDMMKKVNGTTFPDKFHLEFQKKNENLAIKEY